MYALSFSWSIPMLKKLLKWWYARQRKVDLDILWPICRSKAKDLAQAKTAFALHAFYDNAWLSLGEDEVYRIIDELQ